MGSDAHEGIRGKNTNSGRRLFLKSAVAVTAGVAASGALQPKPASSIPPGPPVDVAKMPKIKLGKYTVSRLIMGGNPQGGYSHRGKLLQQVMLEYYTAERKLEVLRHAEQCGITAWQTGIGTDGAELWKKYKDTGGTMDLIVLGFPERGKEHIVLGCKPIAVMHHGESTDKAWKTGKIDEVRDAIRRFREHGLMTGCSTHMPDVLAYMNDHDWECNLYMGCFYQASKRGEEWQPDLGFNPLNREIYASTMPDTMTAVIRQVSKPCLGFKILAAGRIDSEKTVENAYKYALSNIKKTDGIIVGMFPKFSDQLAEGANHVITYGQV